MYNKLGFVVGHDYKILSPRQNPYDTFRPFLIMATAHDEAHSPIATAHGGESQLYDSDTASVASIPLSSKGNSPRDTSFLSGLAARHDSNTESSVPRYFDFSNYKASQKASPTVSSPALSSYPQQSQLERGQVPLRETEDASEKASIMDDANNHVFDTDAESHATRETSLSPTPEQSSSSSFTQVPSAMAMSYPPPPFVTVVDPEIASTVSSLSYARKDRPESLIIDLKSGPLILGVALVDFNHLV